jgi:hypothetical protein
MATTPPPIMATTPPPIMAKAVPFDMFQLPLRRHGQRLVCLASRYSHPNLPPTPFELAAFRLRRSHATRAKTGHH